MKLKKIFNKNNILLGMFSILLVFNINYKKPINSILIIIELIFIFLLCYIIFKKISNIKVFSNKKINTKEYILYSFIIVGALVFSIVCNKYYPTDAGSIYNDVLTGVNNDWHPFLYTILFFKLPLTIYKSFISCSIFQCIFIYFCMLYFCYFLRKYFFNLKQTIIVLLLMVLNPCFLEMFSMLLKDVPFGYTLMIGTIFLIEIVISNGEWIKNKKNKILFITMCFFMVYMRHNGIANFLLMMFLLIILYKQHRKFYLIFLISFLISRAIIIGPIYKILNVNPNGGVGEMLGVPLNQIRYISEYGKGFTTSQRSKLEDIFKKKCWNTKYAFPMYFNAIKFCDCSMGRCNYDFQQLIFSNKEIINMWIKLMVKNPKLALENYLDITSIYWKFDINKSFYWIASNNIIEDNAITHYTNFIYKTYFKYIFINLGEAFMIILFSILIVLKRNEKNIRVLIPYILVLSNFAVACCFVTGDEMRFAYATILCVYPLFIYAISKKIINVKKN